MDGGIGKREQLKEVKGKIALIERGELTFSEKVNHAKQAGAAAVIIYNNTQGSFVGNLEETSTIPVMSVTKKGRGSIKKKNRERIERISQDNYYRRKGCSC